MRDHLFRALFGVSAQMAFMLWTVISVPQGSTMLWPKISFVVDAHVL